MAELVSSRFKVEIGHRLLVQVLQPDAARVLDALLLIDPMAWRDYDRVSFMTGPGEQKFCARSGSRNVPTAETVSVPCVELQLFTCADMQELEALIHAIYDTHPYEEPVIQIVKAQGTRHIPGLDEDNPNRFWNRETADWVPEAHR